MLFKQKLFIPAIAAVLTLTFILSACSAPENETTGNITESSRETPQETTPEPAPDLPEKNMNYKEMKILTSDWWGYEPMNMVDISPDQYDGDLINDVAYERKMKIEQLYTMTVKTIDMTLQNSFESLRTSIMADDNAYDIAFIRGWNVAGLLSGNNYLLDLSALPYVNFDMPWWKKDAYDAFAINGKHFGVTGAMSTNDMMLIMGTCFNKNMVKDYGLESPYALFETGNWTLDKMAEMSKAVAKDLDGDGKMTKDDLWGINYTYETAVGMVNTAGVKIAELNGEGIPVITINTETAIGRMQNIFEKLLDESYSGETLSHMNLPGEDAMIFSDSRCLFLLTAFHTVNALRATEVDFGIIPYPKYDKSQQDYYSYTLGISMPWIVVPTTNPDIENTAVFMEAFAYEGYRTVVPAFYDKILMGKLARDEESIDMLKWLYGNTRYDTGNLFNFGDFSRVLFDITIKRDTNIASILEKNLPVLQKGIDDIIKQIDAGK